MSETGPSTSLNGAILLGATVITMDPGQPRAEALAINGDRIVAVGSAADVFNLARPGSRVLDLRGRAVLPGFHDCHCHLVASAARLFSIDCGPGAVASIKDIQECIRQKTKSLPQGEWVRAAGYNEFYLAEKRHPNRHDLDEGAPSHPVKLTHRSGHAMVLNSMAMSRLAITSITPDPHDGIIDRGQDGEPTGLLLGATAYWDSLIPRPSREDMEHNLTHLGRSMAAAGITSVCDATSSNGIEQWKSLDGLAQSGTLPFRTSMMVSPDSLSDFCEFGVGVRSRGDVQIAGVKIVVDESSGDVHPPPEELERMLMAAHLAGYQTAQHAVEGRPLEVALQSIARVLEQAPRRDHRHRIEHASVCPPSARQQLRRLGMAVVSHPSFIHYGGERYLATVAAEDFPHLYPMGSLLRDGILVAAGSDAPVSGYPPLVGISAAVTRQAETGQPVTPGEAIRLEEALALYTRNAARVLFNEHEQGSIGAGKAADLVVLVADPFATAPDRIKDIPVEMTVVEGRIVHQQD